MKKFNYKNLTPKQKEELIAKSKYKKSNKDLKKLFKKEIRRDGIDLNLLNKLINELPRKTFTQKRSVICVVLLFITGCRINELRNFNKLTINNLIQDGTLIVHTFKTKNTRRIDIGNLEMDLLKSIYPLIDDLYLKLKPENHILYSSTGKEINDRTAYVALNTVLKEFGNKYGVKLLSHSFRIGYITKLLKYYNVQVAKSIIGHKDIASTIRYDRNLLNSNDVKKLLNRISNS